MPVLEMVICGKCGALYSLGSWCGRCSAKHPKALPNVEIEGAGFEYHEETDEPHKPEAQLELELA